MMKISQHIFLAALAALAASCSSDNLPETLSGNGEKTPITIAATISDGGTPLSRAKGKTFAGGDKLIARLRQVTWDSSTDPNFQSVGEVAADQSPRTVTFTVGSGAMTEVNDSTQQTGDLTPNAPLYWDDFSNSASESTDIRTAGHYLQSAWGFCYNGNTPTTSLDETNGTITWTATGNFDSQSTFTKNDLLWSAAQRPISYKHAAGDRETLVIPYTHAMSKFTIVVNATDGFAAGALDNTTIALQDMFSSATFSAPNGEVSAQVGSQSVAMLKATPSGNTCTFTALAIPGKALKGTILAKITNVDGNNYDIPVTDAILAQWHDQLLGVNNDVIKSSINYMLTVTVKKQGISVVARITDWTTINATGEGEIKFNSNIVSSGVTNAITSGSFEIFQGTANTEESLTNVTTATYNAGTSKWELTPQIYWANSTQSYYFRGLATTTDGTTPTATSSKDATQGTDLLWATTPAHDGTLEGGGTRHFDAGVAIPPRTGDVPLQFEHAMSKITVNLSTSTTGKATPTADESARAVDLSNVTVTISNIATAGTIAITDGNIAPTPIAAAVNAAVTGTTPASVSDYTDPIKAIDGTIVIPQSLVNDTYPIKLTIKLSDGTTYSLPLKDCKVSGSESDYIDTWKRGKHYVYNIYVEKEAIRFVAVLKDWVEVNGGGNANLDWD